MPDEMRSFGNWYLFQEFLFPGYREDLKSPRGLHSLGVMIVVSGIQVVGCNIFFVLRQEELFSVVTGQMCAL